MLHSFDNANQALLASFEDFARRDALLVKSGGSYRGISYRRLGESCRRVAQGLLAMGLEPGERMAILAPNSLHWIQVNLGITLAGAIPVALYTTGSPDEIAYILQDVEARFVYVEGEQLRARLPQGNDLSLLEASDLERMLGQPVSRDVQESIAATAARLTRQDTLTIIYTSGTTGQPKGACLTHGNYLASADACLGQIDDAEEIQVLLSFLPLAHSFERLAGHFLALFSGRTVALAEGPEHLIENFVEVRPHMATAVPRFFEKVHKTIRSRIERLPLGDLLFRRAIATATASLDPEAPGWIRLLGRLVDWLLFSRIRARFGGRMKFFISGGAPLRRELVEFFWLVGIPVLEGWGMTEATAPCTLNTPRECRPGSVGKPLPGVEVRAAQDAELEVRGPNIFGGYWRMPEESAQSMTRDGFYRTGDYGRIDEEGYVWITGRKKHLIILSTGKNVAPAAVEHQLVGGLVEQAYIHGDERKYLTALLTLDPDQVATLGLEGRALEDEVGRVVARANGHLPHHMQVKYYRVLPRPFTVESGELTPTLKLRREVISNRYAELLDGMYQD